VNPAGEGRPPLREVSGHGLQVGVAALHKSYAGRAVLEGLELSIAPGEFVAMVGRSGCGKSTLLRLLSGLEVPDAGGIALDRAPSGGLSPEVRFMFQEPRLLPWRRVLANVAVGLPRARRPAAAEALAAVGLLDRAADWPAVLSGGQRQRVALARALVHAPRLLLLDEPLGALDALTRIEMQALVERLWLERGFSAVLVTHDVAEAVALADRVVLLEGGRVMLEEAVRLPRPRRRGSAAFAELEERILGAVLHGAGRPSPEAAAQDRGDASVAARSRRTLRAIRAALRERNGERA